MVQPIPRVFIYITCWNNNRAQGRPPFLHWDIFPNFRHQYRPYKTSPTVIGKDSGIPSAIGHIRGCPAKFFKTVSPPVAQNKVSAAHRLLYTGMNGSRDLISSRCPARSFIFLTYALNYSLFIEFTRKNHSERLSQTPPEGSAKKMDKSIHSWLNFYQPPMVGKSWAIILDRYFDPVVGLHQNPRFARGIWGGV